MNLVNMLTRRDPLKRAFVTLEDGMTDILNEEFMLPPEPEAGTGTDLVAYDHGAEFDPDIAGEPFTANQAQAVDAPADRITAHTQNRLASHAAFEEARARTSQDLNRIGEALGNILTSQNISREFLDDCYADIHRANDLEVANATYAADNRRLTERVDKLEKLRTRYDQLIDVLKRREAKLLLEAETQREHLGSLKLEVVEARNAVSRGESQLAELQATLAARTADAERFMRDAEVLREKNVGLSVDLDSVQKRHADVRRRYEDLSAVHAVESARLLDISGRLSTEENETARLQKFSDALEAKLVEASENVAQLSGELSDRDKRYQSENQSLRAEIQSLNSRLQAANGEQRDAGIEANELRSRLSDLESEKLILEKKFAALASELEKERRRYGMQPAPQSLPLTAPDDVYRDAPEQTRPELLDLKEAASNLRRTERHSSTADVMLDEDLASDDRVANGETAADFTAPAPLARRA